METTPENVDWIPDLINDDPYLTVAEIKEQTGLSDVVTGALLSILFKSTCSILVHRVERGQTIDQEY